MYRLTLAQIYNTVGTGSFQESALASICHGLFTSNRQDQAPTRVHEA